MRSLFIAACAAVAVSSAVADAQDQSEIQDQSALEAQSPADQEAHWSESIASEDGLAAAEAALLAADRRPEDSFALAAVRFLRAIEDALRIRYEVNAAEVGFAPVLRLPIPRNPDAAPFADDTVERVFSGIVDDMVGVREALDEIPPNGDWGATFDLNVLWIDIDGSGAQTPDGRETERLLGLGRAAGLGAASTTARVRFDASDVEWLRAYAHLLSGFGELALAFDPTSATAAVRPGWEAAQRFDGLSFERGEFGAIADQLAVLLAMLRTDPDPARIETAHRHLLEMIAANLRFWAAVDAEDDDRLEWIPNPNQVSGWGAATVDAETAAAWRAALAELQALLVGDVLIAHWRYAGSGGFPVGVSIPTYVADPSPLDPTAWAQGAGAAPYLREGPISSLDAFEAFGRLSGAQSLQRALWFN